MELTLNNKKIFLPLGDILSYTRMLEHYWIKRFAGITKTDKVCDVACGNGFWSNKIAAISSFLVGIDLNEHRIAFANSKYSTKNRNQVAYLVADAQKLPLKTSSQTKVVSYCALEHFPSDIDALREMHRILVKGGILAMSVDSMSLKGVAEEYLEFHRKKYFIHNYYTLASLKEKLLQASFQIKEYRYLTTSRFSSYILKLAGKYRKLFQLLFPVFFPLTLFIDSVSNKQAGGHKLVIKAEAICNESCFSP